MSLYFNRNENLFDALEDENGADAIDENLFFDGFAEPEEAPLPERFEQPRANQNASTNRVEPIYVSKAITAQQQEVFRAAEPVRHTPPPKPEPPLTVDTKFEHPDPRVRMAVAEYAELYNSGVLSIEEFEAKKKQILRNAEKKKQS